MKVGDPFYGQCGELRISGTVTGGYREGQPVSRQGITVDPNEPLTVQVDETMTGTLHGEQWDETFVRQLSAHRGLVRVGSKRGEH